MDAEWGEAVLEAAHDRNLVGLDALAGREGVVPEAAAALKAVPRLRGGREAIAECRAAAASCGVDATLDALDATWDLLETLGVTEAVSIDFGIMRSFDYYTGIVLEAYAPGLGLPIGGGGRYDAVMAEFGRPMPAAGFAIGIERLHIALAEEGVAHRCAASRRRARRRTGRCVRRRRTAARCGLERAVERAHGARTGARSGCGRRA